MAIAGTTVNKGLKVYTEKDFAETSEAILKLVGDLRRVADGLERIENTKDSMSDKEKEKAVIEYLWLVTSLPEIASFLKALYKSMSAALNETIREGTEEA